jgi:hypothetical protein
LIPKKAVIMQSKQGSQKSRRRFRTLWGELQYLCAKIHQLRYGKSHKASSASHYLPRLDRILRKLPENDMAILREEGLAQLHELKGNKSAAIKHRRREIQLMQKLHDEVKNGTYDKKTKAWMLSNRDQKALQQRRAILAKLEREKS